MKNRRWFRLAGWLLTLVMLLMVIPAATFAEDNGGNSLPSEYYKPTGDMLIRTAEIDITDSTKFAYTDNNGKAVKVDEMNPNKENRVTLTVSGLNGNQAIVKETVMTVTLPEDIKITSKGLEEFSNDAVSASVTDGKLYLSWKGEKQDAVTATFAILPNIKAENDLSGSYVLGTGGNQYYKVMLGSNAFADAGNSKRMRLNGIAFEEVDDKVNILSEGAASVWELKHISGNYYTVRSKDNGKYLAIDEKNNGLILEEATELTAQKLLLESIGNGYYSFRFNQKSINNSSFSAEKGFASYNYETGKNAILKLYQPSAVVHGDKLFFSVNGGTGDIDPETIIEEAGTKITLPGLNATKNGQEFIGWAETNNIFSVVSGMNHTYHAVYKPGSTYTLKNGTNTLYAVYNTEKKAVVFGIREDGVIQDEPRDNKETYIGHFTVDGILKEGRWVIDINATKPVKDYYVENDVTAALNWVPSSDEIAAALKKEGGKNKIEFDPETQYIHYYVLKYTTKNGGQWQIDGVIRNKANVEITYDVNVPDGVDKKLVSNVPGGYQVVPGTDVMIGADENSTQIKRPGLKEYFFMGWNTKKDGSGQYYSENSTVHLTNNLYLYAQWVSKDSNPLEIRISSDWPEGKTGYVGARIKMTATLTGFEGKLYTLQWQYSTDQENWIDVPDAHDITYTYTLDKETTNYTWRIVALDIR